MKLIPVFTEKSTAEASKGKYTFKFHPNATKDQIKLAVEKAFNVKVVGVQTINYKSSTRRTMYGKFVKATAYKKAIVTLKKDNKIDLFETKEN